MNQSYYLKFWMALFLLITIPSFINAEDNHRQISASHYSESTMAIGNLLKPSASFLGELSYERVGYSLAGAGDVNGDGFDDVLIGTTHNRANGFDAGAVYLILGCAKLPWKFDTRLANADARFVGHTAYDAAGYSVACNGDLNGDGFDDILIGAPAGNDQVKWMPGRVYIVFGKAAANWGYDFPLFYDANAIYLGENGQDLAGLSVAFIGDVNADGFDDFVVGAPYTNQGGEDAGKVYLILGRREPWSAELNLADAAASFVDFRAHALTGYSVAGLGDVNRDGTPDFAIGAYGSSRVFVIYGRRSVNWGSDFDLDDADMMIYGVGNEGLGWKIAGPGDLNGDGVPDLIMSAVDNNDGGERAGKVYVKFFSGAGHSLTKTSLNNMEASFIGERANDNAGWGLSGAGDVDGDGYNDFLIGAWYNDQNGADAGKAYLIKGKATGWQYNVPLSSVPDYFLGEREINYAGYSVGCAGDFDRDGIGDYVISAPYNSEVSQWSGEIYLFTSQMMRYQISGKVTYFQSGAAIPGAILQADNQSTASDTTDRQGNYLLSVLGNSNHTVRIEKKKNEHVGSCITSYDAALIAKLSLDLDISESINTKAADASLNGRINMYDAALTLHHAVQMPPLPASHTGEWDFIPDSMFYSSITADLSNQNYVGYIRGDVDMSWQYPGAGLSKFDASENQIALPVIRQGDQVILPLNYNGDVPLLSFDIDLSYDQDVLEFLRIETTLLTADFQLACNPAIHNRLLIGAFRHQAITTAGSLVSIIFKIKDSPATHSEIELNRFQINNLPAQQGTVEIALDDKTSLPDKFKLHQNYPNPFNNLTTIAYHALREEHVAIIIYNTLGKEIKKLIDQRVLPGENLVTWNGMDEYGVPVAAGVYICRAVHVGGSDQIKIMYLK